MKAFYKVDLLTVETALRCAADLGTKCPKPFVDLAYALAAARGYQWGGWDNFVEEVVDEDDEDDEPDYNPITLDELPAPAEHADGTRAYNLHPEDVDLGLSEALVMYGLPASLTRLLEALHEADREAKASRS